MSHPSVLSLLISTHSIPVFLLPCPLPLSSSPLHPFILPHPQPPPPFSPASSSPTCSPPILRPSLSVSLHPSPLAHVLHPVPGKGQDASRGALAVRAAGGGWGGGAAPLFLEGVPPAAPPLQAPLLAAAPQAGAAALFAPRGRLAVVIAILVPQGHLGKGENAELVRGGGGNHNTLAHRCTYINVFDNSRCLHSVHLALKLNASLTSQRKSMASNLLLGNICKASNKQISYYKPGRGQE